MKTVIIMTMPRSGSSLLAGVLHRMGVPMGSQDDLHKGKHLNRYGCHEDQWFQSISMNILLESGILLDLPGRLQPDEARIRTVVGKYQPEIERFVAKRRREIWGFKDNGVAYHLPYCHQFFENPVYVHLTRDTNETARSWSKTFRSSHWLPEFREKFPLIKGGNRFRVMWHAVSRFVTQQPAIHDLALFESVVDRGHERIRDFLKTQTHVSIGLADLLTSPGDEIRRLAALLEVEPSESSTRDAADFIKPDLLSQHNAADLVTTCAT